jgi:hypothetical protein
MHAYRMDRVQTFENRRRRTDDSGEKHCKQKIREEDERISGDLARDRCRVENGNVVPKILAGVGRGIGETREDAGRWRRLRRKINDENAGG